VILKGSKKCCISNAMYVTDHAMMWQGSEEDGNVRSECQQDSGTDCENRDSDTDWYRQIESDILFVITG
jgi:hypothetical protein